jgi:hypothetical protein
MSVNLVVKTVVFVLGVTSNLAMHVVESCEPSFYRLYGNNIFFIFILVPKLIGIYNMQKMSGSAPTVSNLVEKTSHQARHPISRPAHRGTGPSGGTFWKRIHGRRMPPHSRAMSLHLCDPSSIHDEQRSYPQAHQSGAEHSSARANDLLQKSS